MLQRILRPVGLIAAIAFLALVGLVLAADHASPAYAAGGGKPAPSNLYNDTVTTIQTPATGWSGCGVGIHAGIVNADADFGAPINIGSNGQLAGLGAYCDRAFDRFVIGLFGDFSWAFGDIHSKTIGADSDVTLGGRAGVLVTRDILAYALAAWTRVDGQFKADHITGLKVGGGMEVKIPSSPFFLALEYQKATYSNVAGSSIDINADEVMLRLRYKFSTGAASVAK